MFIREFLHRLLSVARKDQKSRELDEELASHLDLLTQENIAKGMDPDSARRAARLKLGGDAQIREAYREQAGLPFLETLFQDIRYGARLLRKNPTFTLVAVLTLALGIGANSAIFSVVYAVILRPLPYAHPEELVSIRGGQSWPDLDDFRRQNHTLKSLGAFWPSQYDLLTDNREPEQIEGAMISFDLFDTLGVPPELGRTFSATDDVPGGPRVVVLGHAFWRDRYAADPNAIGKMIRLGDSAYQIIGVMPQNFWLPGGEGQFFVPFRIGYSEAAAERGVHAQYAIARMRPGVTRAQLQADIDSIAAELAKLYPAENRDRRFPVLALQERVVGRVRTPVLILFGAVGLVLLIASLNFANLLLAKASARKEEIQIRAALGASPSRLVRQFLTESVMLSLLGGVVGLGFAYFALRALLLLEPGDIPRLASISIDLPVLFFCLALALVTGVLFGLLPVLSVLRANSNLQVRTGVAAAGQSAFTSRLRQSLIVVEFTVALVLLCGAGLLLRSMSRLNAVDSGFDPNGLMTARIMLQAKKYETLESQARFFAALEQRLQQIPGAEQAGLVSELPMSNRYIPHNVVFNGRPPVLEGTEPDVLTNLVSPSFFGAMRTPLLSGRVFDSNDRAGSAPVAIINDAMAARYYPGEDPLGKQIAFARGPSPQRQWMTIVGVVGNIRDFGPDQEEEPTLFTPMQQKVEFWRRWTGIVVRGSDAAQLPSGVKQAVWAIDPEIPVTKITPMTSLVASSLSQRRFTTLLLILFAATALALAMIGIYGVIAYSVIQRTREIGVRIALGAQRGDVLWIVLRQAIMLGLVGVALGTIGSLFATRALQSLVFGVTPRDPATFISVALLLLTVAIIAAVIPALRATRIDPTSALRAE
jgi:putative ABC transport system permease protein